MRKNYEATMRHRQIILLILISVFVLSVVLVTISVLIIAPGIKETDEYKGKKNILFIIVDDLRPTLGCYGDRRAITPNIDQLASKSVLFKNAYAQQALCGPSRTSLLTSRRPDSLHLYDVGSYWRDTVGNFVSLPQHFKLHSYETISVGKVFHHGIVSNKTDDYPYSWTNYPHRPPTQKYKMAPVCPSPSNGHMNLICPVDVNEQPLKSLPDIEITDYAIQYLKNKSQGSHNEESPFFLAVGYNKPHIPFKFPKEYLDLYPINTMDLAPNYTKSSNLPDISWNPWTDIRERDDVSNLNVTFPYGPLPENFQKLARQGYYASLSYMDDQLGKLLNTLEETGFAAHTTIVLIGDHGWSLGEHQEWSKYSNFEVSVRVPLIVHIPELMEYKKSPFHYIPVLEQIKNNGSRMVKPKYETEELVELVDLFPTLAAIAVLPVPPLCRIYTTPFCSEGLSFYSLIKHLIKPSWFELPWKTAVFSQYPRPSLVPQNNSDQPKLEDIKYMGYSIRTAHFRYTEWVDFDNQLFRPNWTVVYARELYDHNNDPFEAENICKKDICDDEYENTVKELSKKIRKGWRHAMPPSYFDSISPTRYF
ncbi:iduronate 2-sulfatase [Parasteatoda tepidariorum]|uniref:iduronate 2-sulfatase n=1 Tax=Parasteatoda tepidariorum TaxID=114398 RepID=UPI00077FB33A|nr:iduronate 2-sulfatase [Parasteatoda tepidariorum]